MADGEDDEYVQEPERGGRSNALCMASGPSEASAPGYGGSRLLGPYDCSGQFDGPYAKPGDWAPARKEVAILIHLYFFILPISIADLQHNSTLHRPPFKQRMGLIW